MRQRKAVAVVELAPLFVPRVCAEVLFDGFKRHPIPFCGLLQASAKNEAKEKLMRRATIAKNLKGILRLLLLLDLGKQEKNKRGEALPTNPASPRKDALYQMSLMPN